MVTIGIDLGGTIIKTGLVSNGKIIECRTMEASSVSGLHISLCRIEDSVNSLLSGNGIEKSELEGIAIAFAGLVDVGLKRVTGTNKKYGDPGEVDLEKWVYSKWGCSFFIDNDARMAAVGEWKYGAGKGFDDIVTVTIGTGIGTSVITGGRLIRGKHFQFGCLGGHFTVKYGGNECTCGNKGCVEAEAGSLILPEMAKRHPGFSSSELSKVAVIDFESIFRLSETGDSLSIELRDKCMHVWSAAIVNYIHAYDPEIVIIGGGVMNSSQIILPYIQSFVDKYAWTPTHRVIIKCSEKGDTAAILGAAYCLTDSIALPV